jgi:hypothetical protein
MNQINTNEIIDATEAIEIERAEADLDEMRLNDEGDFSDLSDEEQMELIEESEGSELTLEQVVDQVLDQLKLNEFTMYQIAKALNMVLEVIDASKGFGEDGEPLAYRVRPQMIYNYNRNKMVAQGTNGKGITLTESATLAQARAFIIKFSTKFVK